MKSLCTRQTELLSLAGPMARGVGVDLRDGIYRSEPLLIMVVFDCILSFEQINGKLDGYCKWNIPAERN